MRNTILRAVLGTATAALVGLGVIVAPAPAPVSAAPAKAVRCKTLPLVNMGGGVVKLRQQNLNGTGTPTKKVHSFIGYWRYNGKQYSKTYKPTQSTYTVEKMPFYKIRSWDKGQECSYWINPYAPVGTGY